ncbi:uncharacterized protein ACNLHF_020147 [Anomaloglossus baeobatrachus]|uniref:uncharacterized protein LOC142250966 n=1 Tax=Anomaloglossus baeobatrachus TaxID=238106 RepID=UPI003F5036C8
MPVCWITGCKYTPGRVHNGHEIKLHSFPNSLQRIKDWLLEMGQNFKDIDNVARQILDNKQRKCNKFRLCSLHFSDNSFIVNVCGRTLRPNAVPTIFDNVPFNAEKVNEDLSLRKTFKRKREDKTSLCVVSSQYPSLPLSIKSEVLGDFPLYTTTESENENCSIDEETEDLSSQIIVKVIKSEVLDDLPIDSASTESETGSKSGAINEAENTKSHQDAQTQTEFTFKNSIIYLLDNDFLTGNPAIDPCGPPYCTVQNPIVALNCHVQAPGSLS